MINLPERRNLCQGDTHSSVIVLLLFLSNYYCVMSFISFRTLLFNIFFIHPHIALSINLHFHTFINVTIFFFVIIITLTIITWTNQLNILWIWLFYPFENSSTYWPASTQFYLHNRSLFYFSPLYCTYFDVWI